MDSNQKLIDKTWNAQKINRELHINRIYSFFKENREAGYTFRGESHGFWECMYIENGCDNCVITVAGDRVYKMGKGEMVFFKPYEFHKFQVLSDCTITVIAFNLFGRNISYYENKLFKLNKFQKNIIENMISYAEEIAIHHPYERNSFDRYLRSFKTDSTYSQMILTYIYQILLTIMENHIEEQSVSSEEAKIFHRAVCYMKANISAMLSVEEIAKEVNTSRSTLKRIFKNFINMPVHKYFIEMKLDEATKYLREGHTVCEVAEQLGFSSQGYFSNVYKRERGISPSMIKSEE